MSEFKLAVILIVLGMLGLANGGFHYFRVANAAGVAAIPAAFEDSGFLSVSFALGASAILAGAILLLTRDTRFDLNK